MRNLKSMKSSFLHFLLTFLLLISAPVGTRVQSAFVDSSDDIRVVTVYSSAQENTPVLLNETKASDSTVIRSSRIQRKTISFKDFSAHFSVENCGISLVIPPFLSFCAQFSFRVLLLPKTILTLIYIQTLF